MDEIKVGPLLRELSTEGITVEKRDAGARLLFSASSEAPAERFFGTEILSHEPGAIRMERFANGAVPLLWNHNWDHPIGMVDGARVANNRLMVDAHLFATERAQEVQAMIDGGLRNVSIGYQINELEEDKKRGAYVATSWTPLEVSVVSVPLDHQVGIGRNFDKREVPVRIRAADQPAAQAASTEDNMSDKQNAAAGVQAEVQVIDNGAQERLRIKTIQTLGRTHKIDNDTVDKWVDDGVTSEEAAQKVLDVIAERSRRAVKDHPHSIGLTPAEAQRFSIVRAINAVVQKDWTKAGFEAETSRAVAQRMGKVMNEHTFLIPMEVQQRVLQVATSAQAGYAVGTDIQPQSFVDLLRNRSVAIRLGARELMGLVGNVTIPKQASAGSVAWIGEVGTATASEMALSQLTLSPKHIAGYQEISRQALLQTTPDIEQLVQADLAAQIALGLDSAVLAGTGTATPTGIRYTSGLGTANPTSGTNVNYADMIRFQSTVAASNAMFPNFAYVCHPTIAAVLMGKPRFTNSDTPIWQGGVLDGMVVGKPALSTLQVTSGTVLGGDFGQVIVGIWGPTVEVEVNPYANFQAGIVGVRAFLTADVAIRHGAAFAIGTGISG